MAYSLSRDLRKTPAEVYAVGESLVGPYNLGADIAIYSFNRAVIMFGKALTNELESVESNAKDPKQQQREIESRRTAILHQWLSIDKAPDAEPPAKPARMFADPANR
jgi:hypothetical protein